MLNWRLIAVAIRSAKQLRLCSKHCRCLSQGPFFQWNLSHTRVLACVMNRGLSAPSTLVLFRNKYSRKPSKSNDENSDSEDESDDRVDEVPEKGSKVMSVTVASLRADLLIKSGLQMARNKVENIFYQSRIRVNGQKILKKSAQINDGDEIDIIRGFSPMNPNFLVVSRLEILSVKPKEDDFSVKLKRSKSLVVENYSEPWKQSQSEE